MTNETLKVGDVVILKSGGRSMTVVEISDDPNGYNVACMLQDRGGSVRRIWTPAAALTKYIPPKRIEEAAPSRPASYCSD